MVKGDLWHEIHSRFKLKETKKAIARALRLDVRTVRKLLSQEAPKAYERERKGSRLLTGFEERIRRRVAAVGYCAMSIYEELRADGFCGGYDVVRRFVGPLREEATIEATVRFETPPGRQGQADWGQCWTIIAEHETRFPGALRDRLWPTLRHLPDGFSLEPYLDARGHLALPIAKGLVSFVRKVDSHGRIEFNGAAYVIRRKLERQYVVATLSTHHRRVFIKHEGKLIKTFPFPLTGKVVDPLT